VEQLAKLEAFFNVTNQKAPPLTPREAGFPFPSEPFTFTETGEMQLLGVITLVRLVKDDGSSTEGCRLRTVVTDSINWEAPTDTEDFGWNNAIFYHKHKLNVTYAGNWYIDTPIRIGMHGKIISRYFEQHVTVIDEQGKTIPGLEAYYGYAFQISGEKPIVKWKIWPDAINKPVKDTELKTRYGMDKVKQEIGG
jgi:hypothetical protein